MPTEQMGKPAGSDRAHAQQAMQEAIDALQPFDARADPLRWLATFAVERRQ